MTSVIVRDAQGGGSKRSVQRWEPQVKGTPQKPEEARKSSPLKPSEGLMTLLMSSLCASGLHNYERINLHGF